MFNVIIARLLQGHRTMKFPDGAPPEMFDRFCGCPQINGAKCPRRLSRLHRCVPDRAPSA